MNIGALLKLPPQTDLNRFVQVVNDTLNYYDIFRCRLVFHPVTNDICQRFDGEIIPVVIEKISDEELEQRKKELMQPYELVNKPLYRIYIFETPTAKYLYLDFYHAILDGTSASVLFWREVAMRYKGKKITRTPLNYADYILDELKVSPEELAEGYNFWHEMLNNIDPEKYLPLEDVGNFEDVEFGQMHSLLVLIKNITQKYFVKNVHNENIFFLAAAMLTFAKISGSKISFMNWIHNGRHTMQERRLMGAMLEQYFIVWNFEKDMTAAEFLNGIAEKMNVSLKYRRSLEAAYSAPIELECPTFNFQKNILTFPLGDSTCEVVDLPPNKWTFAENSLDIEVNLNDDGNYYIYFDYDSGAHSAEVMEKFAATFDEIVLQLQDENILISKIL